MRLRLISLISLLIGSLVLAACGQQQISAEEIVARMEATRDTMQDVHATVALNFTTNERSGNLVVEGWLKKTDRTDAEGKPITKVRAIVREASEAELKDSLLVSDGETFWLYNPSANQVITGSRADLPNNKAADPTGTTQALQDLIQRGMDALNVEVLGEEQVAGQNTWKLKLTPKTETSQQLQLDGIVEATMWVDEARALPLKLDIDASDMGQGTLEVRSITMNSGLSDDLFTFTAPAGATVTQASDLAGQMQPKAVTLDEARAAVDFPLLAPQYLPGGATLVEVRLLGKQTVIQNYASGGVTFSVVQSRTDVGSDREPPAGSAVQELELRGQTATLISGNADQQGSLLRWEENGVRIIVAGTLSSDDALKVAESLK